MVSTKLEKSRHDPGQNGSGLIPEINQFISRAKSNKHYRNCFDDFNSKLFKSYMVSIYSEAKYLSFGLLKR